MKKYLALIDFDSPLTAWFLAAVAFAFAAVCGLSLAWDGSYYLLHILQDGEPFVPHHRWLNTLLQRPVLWLLNGTEPAWNLHPWLFAVAHGAMCALLPLGSLAACFAMLNGGNGFARFRFWAALAILLAPLPGYPALIGESMLALGPGAVCLAFVWRGCPWRWAPVVALAGVAMWGLHPEAAVIFGLAATTAGLLGWATRKAQSGLASGLARRFWIWAGLFLLAALLKFLEVRRLATDYERANLSLDVWAREGLHGLLLTPFPALVFVAIFAGLTLRGRPVSRHAARWLWGLAFAVGLAMAAHPMTWSGALNFRKFAVVMFAGVALLAGIEAWRFWKNAAAQTGGENSGMVFSPDFVPVPGRSLLLPVILFAVIFGAVSVSWVRICGSFLATLKANPAMVQSGTLLPGERWSALDHWSATSLSLVLQGWEPVKIHINDPALQRCEGGDGGWSICPGEPFRWEDGAFKLAWIGRLRADDAPPR